MSANSRASALHPIRWLLLVFAGLAVPVFSEDAYVIYNPLGVMYLASATLQIEAVTAEEAAHYAELRDHQLDREIAHAPVSDEFDKDLNELTYKVLSPFTRREDEVKRIVSEIAKKHGLKEMPIFHSRDEAIAFKEVLAHAKKVDVTGEIVAILTRRIFDKVSPGHP